MEDNKDFVICFDCGEEIQMEDAIEMGGEYFCEVCIDEYEVCRICGKVHLKENMGYDKYHDNYVCEDCYEDYNMITCEDCGEIVDEYAIVDNGDIYVCLDCAKNNYYECDHCGDFYTLENVYTDSFGNCVCEDCYDREYTTCDDCGEIICLHEANRTICGDVYCDGCYDDHNEGEIHNYSYKPSPYFFYATEDGNTDYSCNETKNTLYLGVELEVDKGYDKIQMAQDIHEALEWTYCKEDSSLDDGIELVSHPMTLDFAMVNKEVYNNVFDDLLRKDWRGHDAETCGLHCHVNRTFFGDNEDTQDLNIAKVILLVNNLWGDMKTFSRRTEAQLNRWAKRYCEVDGIEEEEEIVKTCKRQFNRYYAINIQNKNTVEFRLFRSSLKLNTFYATLQFVSNICHLIKETSLKDIENITMLDILKYNEYEELKQYYIQRKLLKEEK